MWIKNSNGKIIKNPVHAENLITEKEANEFFEKDIKKAENMLKHSLKMAELDDNVQHYILLNQNIFDALLSLTYNSGYLVKDDHSTKFELMKYLKKCRFDYTNNTINTADYNFTIPKFCIKYKNNALTKRRQNEYNLFDLANANIPFEPSNETLL